MEAFQWRELKIIYHSWLATCNNYTVRMQSWLSISLCSTNIVTHALMIHVTICILYACVSICMYPSGYDCMHVKLCMHMCVSMIHTVCTYICSYVCTYVCMYVCVYVCMYVSMHICDRIWETLASMHTSARHTFHHQTIAVHIN